jgi:hemolysin activation/secretion protein
LRKEGSFCTAAHIRLWTGIITASSVPSHQTTSEGEEKTERETQQQAEEEGEQENVPPPSQSPDKPPGQDIPDDLMSDNGL